MKSLLYTIELLEPVLVTSLDGDPNSSVSFDYLPGTALRGMIIGRFLAAKKKEDTSYQLDAADETAGRLFFNGRTRYLNGYLDYLSEGSQQIRALPLPRSLFTQKGMKEPIFDFAGDDHPPDLQQPKPLNNRFGTFQAGLLYPLPVQKTIAVHTARNRRFGRAVSGDPKVELTGAVYRYEALAPDQVFMAAVLCEDEDAELLASLLDGPGMLGGSRSAGYGRVRLTLLDIQEAGLFDETSCAYPFRKTSGNNLEVDETAVDEERQVLAGRLIITLLSDVLLRDPSGQYSVDPAVLCRELELDLLPGLAFSERQPAGSFNRKWGLPTAQAPVFAMGSVFVCQAPGGEGMKALAEKQAAGIGEKRAEGFGRFAVNWYHGKKVDRVEDLPGNGHDPVSLPEGSPARDIAVEIAGRLLERRIEIYINTEAALLAKPQPGLQKSQVYRLQQQILSSLQAPELNLERDRKRIEAYLKELQKRAVTRKQFARTRIDGRTIPEWISDLLSKRDIGEMRDQIARHVPIQQIGDVKPDIDEALIYRSNLRLINEVLSRIAKLTKDH